MRISKLDRVTEPVRDLVDRMPLIHWGRPLFAPPDEIDGTHINGMTLRRMPDGSLMGVLDPPQKENKS